MNYLLPDPHETSAPNLDVLRLSDRGTAATSWVDTVQPAERSAQPQAHAQSGRRAGAFGVEADSIGDVMSPSALRSRRQSRPLSNARFHLQDREMGYATGAACATAPWRHPFSVIT